MNLIDVIARKRKQITKYNYEEKRGMKMVRCLNCGNEGWMEGIERDGKMFCTKTCADAYDKSEEKEE